MKFICAALTAICLFSCVVHSNAQQKKLNYNSTLYLSAQNIYGLSARSFFDDYHTYVGGVKSELKYSWAVETGIKMQFSKSIRYGACVSYIRGKFQDEYDYEVIVGENKFGRYHRQDMDFLNSPVLITAEYMPYDDSQFRNYYGLGAGISVYEVKWRETVNSSMPEIDPRYGDHKTTENGIAPTLRAFAGTELQFDKKWYEKFFTASLAFEVEYTYAFRSVDIFKAVKKGIPNPKVLKDSYNMFPGYLGLSMILSFNFTKMKF